MFIWDKASLEEHNDKIGKEEDKLKPTYRDDDFEYTVGIRAHRNMNWKRATWSIMVPWHNDWLSIMLYLGFSIYFWVQTFIIMA